MQTMIPHKQEKEITLRPYQIDAMQAVISNQNATRALVVLPTGTGKTEVFSRIIQSLNVPTLVLAHRKELLTQAKNKLLRYYHEDDIGIVGNGIEQWDKPVIVASVQTMRKRLKRLQAMGVKLIVCDECHHATKKNSYATVFNALPDAYTVGFTATPERLDGASIADIFGTPVYEQDIITMVRAGYLCDLRGILVRSNVSLDDLKKQLGDFQEQQLAELVNEDERNALIVQSYLTYSKDKRAICFAVNVEHAHALADTFTACGISSIAIDGKTPQDTRSWALEQFEQGYIKVLVNCELFTEGFDAPYVECIIMARPTLSRGLFMQMIGRGTRLHEGKTECIILDITDNCTRHKMTPRSFKDVMKLDTRKKNVSLLEYDEDEEIRIAHEQRVLRERREAIEAARIERERLQAEAIRRIQEIEEGKQVAENERKQKLLKERGNVSFEEITLLSDTIAKWEEGINERTIATVQVAYVTISIATSHEGTGYDVIASSKYETRRIGHSIPLSQAKQVAENHARSIATRLASKHDAAPTDKQLETLRKFRIVPPIGCTFGMASQMISNRIASLPKRKSA